MVMLYKQREDFREGRPNKYTKKQLEHALGLLETHSYKEVEETTGISKSTLIRAKTKGHCKRCGLFYYCAW
jgi:hypothetical protein